MNYDGEFLRQGEASDPGSYQLVTEPDMGAVDDDGNGAGYILLGGSEDCDIPETDLSAVGRRGDGARQGVPGCGAQLGVEG